MTPWKEGTPWTTSVRFSHGSSLYFAAKWWPWRTAILARARPCGHTRTLSLSLALRHPPAAGRPSSRSSTASPRVSPMVSPVPTTWWGPASVATSGMWQQSSEEAGQPQRLLHHIHLPTQSWLTGHSASARPAVSLVRRFFAATPRSPLGSRVPPGPIVGPLDERSQTPSALRRLTTSLPRGHGYRTRSTADVDLGRA